MESALAAEWLRTLYLLGAAQGIFLAAILASRRLNSLPNKLLGLLMLVFSMDLFAAVYHAGGYARLYPWLIGFDFPLTLLYGPLLYLYTRTLAWRQSRLSRIDWLHFAPFVVLVVALVPFYVQSGPEKLAFLSAPDQSRFGGMLALATHLKLAHGLAYVLLTVQLVRSFRRQVADTGTPLERVHLAWLRYVIAGIIFLMAVAGTVYGIEVMDAVPVMGMDPTTPYDDFTLLSVTVFVYAVGYLGLRQPYVFEPEGYATANGHKAGIKSNGAAPEGSDFGPRYAKSGMDEAAAKAYLASLHQVMEMEAPYRRGELTLQDLADMLSISSHNLTEVLNTQLGQNFYDFVNGYRVREVQKRLADPADAHFTLLAIAEDAGFNSKSSFNAVFKKHTGMTPSEYRRHRSGQVPAS